ncbi:MAG: ABC transporter permease [Anaerolineales bacterium]
MRLTDVALKNLWRRKGRMVLLVLGLAIGVATAVALMAITEAMQADVAVKMDEYGANILVVPKANDLALSYGGITVGSAAYDVATLSMPDVERIHTIKNAANISVVAPKLLGAVPVRGRPVLLAGVRFADELRLKRWWRVEQGMEPSEAADALAGARLAQSLSIQPGDEIEVNGQKFHVVGVLAENGSQDDDILFVDLSAAQQALGKPDAVSLVEVAALCTACPVDDMVEQIGHVLPQARVTALRQAVTLRMETVGQLGRFAVAVSGVVIAIGALVVLTTMLGAVAERRQEIGLFRALGFRQRHVGRIVLTEAALVSAAGGALGYLAGMGAAVTLAPRVANVAARVPWDPVLAAAAVGCALAVGVLASLYPAAQAARVDPTVALRSL